jgi:hypothetical protein
MALKPAAVVLNGPDVPLLANARTFLAADPNSSAPSLSVQVRPTCGRKGSSIVPVLRSTTTVRQIFQRRLHR